MSMTHNPTMRHPGEGRTIGVVGDVYRFLATGEDTNGKYAMWEAIVLRAAAHRLISTAGKKNPFTSSKARSPFRSTTGGS